MPSPALVILAAGIGSRFGGFKQLDPLGPNGEIILDYSIYDALRAGFGEIVLVVREELEEPLAEHLAHTLGDTFRPVFVRQDVTMLPDGFSPPADRRKPWGTAHAVWCARSAVVGRRFGVANADDFYGRAAFETLARSLERMPSGECRLIGFPLLETLSKHGTVSRGVCEVDEGGRLRSVVEHLRVEPDGSGGARSLGPGGTVQNLSPDAPTSMNMWGFGPDIWAPLEEALRDFLDDADRRQEAEFLLPTFVDGLIRSGKIVCRVVPTRSRWFGLTYREDREAVAKSLRELVQDGRYPATLRLAPD